MFLPAELMMSSFLRSTIKLKRRVINAKYAGEIEALYY
jgi:hypothetical protein